MGKFIDPKMYPAEGRTITIAGSGEDEYVPAKDTLPAKLLIVPGVRLALVERAHILETLKDTGFNRTHTARKLGIGVRTLQRKLTKYGASTWQYDGDAHEY